MSRRFYVAVSAGLLVWWVATVTSDNSFNVVRFRRGGLGGDSLDVVSATQAGDFTNQALIIVFGLLGAVNLLRIGKRMRASVRFRRLVLATLVPFVVYSAWAALSITWSIAPSLSIRRLAALEFTALGAFGLGAGFYGSMRDGWHVLARHVAIGGSIAMLWLWVPTVALGAVDIFNPSWALLDPGRGSVAANPIGLAVLAAVFLAVGREVPRRLTLRSATGAWLMLGAAGIFTLFALRKRMTFTVTLVLAAVYLLWLLRRSPRLRNVMVLTLLVAIVGIASLEVVANVPIVENALPIAARDLDEDNVTSLNNRIPLWQTLGEFINDRPFQGHGYGAFWNPTLLPQVQDAVGWPVVVAHNGFVDETLATGYVGVALIAGLFIFGVGAAFMSEAREGTGAGLFTGFVLVNFIFSNSTQTVLQAPDKTPFIAALVVLFALAGWRSPAPSTPPAPPRPRVLTRA